MSASRPSGDPETAPLLHSTDNDDHAPEQHSFLHKLTDIVDEPLTRLTKILLGLCLFLLLLSSIFVGLFAGAEHKLNQGNKPSNPRPSVTQSYTVTHTLTETTISTTTDVVTTTLPAPPSPTGEPEPKVCTSAQCIILSASILSSIDTTYDPCEDFYLYTTNGWLKSHPIPSDKGSYGNFEDVQLHNEVIIREILEAPIPESANEYDQETLQKTKDLYNECLNEDKLDNIGIAPLIDVVRVVRGLYNGSTSLDPQSYILNPDGQTRLSGSTNGRLTATLAYLHSRGIGALFGFQIDGDIGVDPDDMSLWFWQPELGLPSKEYYEEPEIREIYRKALERLLFAIFEEEESSVESSFKWWPPIPWPKPPKGGDDDDDTGNKENITVKAARLSKQVLKFETKIARASQDLDELFDPVGSYNPTPFNNLTAGLPQINFPNYLATFAPRAFPSKVIVTYPPFVSSLSSILDTADSETIEAYFISRVALTLSSLLGPSTEPWKAVRELNEILAGLKKGAVPDRAEYCAKQVSSVMGYATGRYFVQEAFGGNSKDRAGALISNVIDAFKESLPHLTWMDSNSSAAADEKASAIEVKVGYPMFPNTESAFSIWSYYQSLEPADQGYFGTILYQSTIDEIRTWQKLGRKRNHLEWEMYASTVNAYFNPPAQEIVFPAGIMRSPWYNVEWPGYLNYGGMGAIAAHELTHAFDSAGRMFNQKGKLEEWWTNSTSENFDVIQKCISKQYSSYTIDDGKGNQIPVNGELTSGENIADQGLINAYRAWKSQYNDSLADGNEYLLPGLNYTREQLFFISFGRTWARNVRPASAVQRIRTDPHSPTQFRVQGTLYNIPEFAKAFNCSAGSKLNPPPEKQCRLWS